MKRIIAIIGLTILALGVLFAMGYFLYKAAGDNIYCPIGAYSAVIGFIVIKLFIEWALDQI